MVGISTHTDSIHTLLQLYTSADSKCSPNTGASSKNIPNKSTVSSRILKTMFPTRVQPHGCYRYVPNMGAVITVFYIVNLHSFSTLFGMSLQGWPYGDLSVAVGKMCVSC